MASTNVDVITFEGWIDRCGDASESQRPEDRREFLAISRAPLTPA